MCVRNTDEAVPVVVRQTRGQNGRRRGAAKEFLFASSRRDVLPSLSWVVCFLSFFFCDAREATASAEAVAHARKEISNQTPSHNTVVCAPQHRCPGGRNGLALLSPRVRVSVSAVALRIPSTPAPAFLRGHLTVTTLGLSESRSVCRLERWGALERAHSARRARAVSPAKARAGAEPVEGQHR